ncbi:hypothetical protein MKX01_000992 [Papaver californicum]|nr:hypothetical protein MKX01_000992 [Papaver californicum]
MPSCRSSSIWLFVFAMLPLSAYSGCCCTLFPLPAPAPPPSCRPGDLYRQARGSSCITCALNCRIKCDRMFMGVTQLSCNKYPYIKECDCCCTLPSPPPSSPPPPRPSPPPPSPPPPSPSPTPSPAGDKCDKPGDTYSEITYPTSDCTYCTNWCKDECSEMEGKEVSNKCSIGESKFVTRCKCCCLKNPSLKLYGNKDDEGRASKNTLI